ncbi:putative glutaredoxin-C14 [Lycium barbarum]|uniref:putative glutaredoxin-C14 n=1 Tax=Lycium barbarum TaxID=112863 RepID=UPI00293F4AE3|nr:putative glutaredoxin-C14 [Lycium barbarum]
MRRTIFNSNLFSLSAATGGGSMSSSSIAASGSMSYSAATARGSMSSSSATATGGTTSREAQPPTETNNNIVNGHTSAVKLIKENAVVVVATRGCYMCLVVKHLLQDLCVNTTLFEVDEADKAAVLEELSEIEGREGGNCREGELPAVFVGGKLLGGVNKVMETHILGELVPMLRQAGALWL